MFRKIKGFNKDLVWFGVLFSVCLVMLPKVTEAASASLYLSPSTGNYIVGSVFEVKAKVNSGGVDINTVGATLSFNPGELNVISISKTGSIFSLWPIEPTYSNSGGTIEFGGGTPNKFNGTSGTIFTISFRTKKTAAQSLVFFSSGSVLAADGKATNVLETMSGGIYTITSQVVSPDTQVVSPGEEEEEEEEEILPPVTPATGPTPKAPIISSTTHPDPEKWYSNNDPEFSWEVSTEVTAVELLISEKANLVPTILYKPPISEKKLEDLKDGVWYFYVRFKNKYGWGKIASRKVLIDTEQPESFKIEVDNEGDIINPRPILLFETEDVPSGIEYYEVIIDGGKPQRLSPENIKENPYRMPFMLPGRHSVIVRAVDKAGNSTATTTDVTIQQIEKPLITDFPEKAKAGDILTIKGTSSYPGGTVTVFIQKKGEEPRKNDIEIDGKGNWIFIDDESLKDGKYQIWAMVTDNRGAQSDPTEKITLIVVSAVLFKFTKIILNYFPIIITALVVALLIIGIFYVYFKVLKPRRKAKKITKKEKEDTIKAFKNLEKKVEEQIKSLNKCSHLTEKEKEILEKLKITLKIWK